MQQANNAAQDRRSRGIASTMENLVRCNMCIVESGDPKMKAKMRANNDRRQQALEQMQGNSGSNRAQSVR